MFHSVNFCASLRCTLAYTLATEKNGEVGAEVNSSSANKKPSQDANDLIASLPPADQRRLAKVLASHNVRSGESIHQPGELLSHIVFPVTCLVSLVTRMENGAVIECATIGNEGVVGLPIFLERRAIAIEAIGQIPGLALRMPSAAFAREIANKGSLYDLLNNYTSVLLLQIAQSAACSRVHHADKRCARWLLMAHDRVEGDTFRLTHESLAEMLGVRRATVTVAVSALRRKSLISYHQGTIRIRNRDGLEENACECYRIIRDEFDLLHEQNRALRAGHKQS